MKLNQFLEGLLDEGQAIRPNTLSPLSGLSPADVGLLSTIWVKIKRVRRLELLNSMVGLTEESIDLNFSSIFKFALTDDSPDVRKTAVSGLWECQERSLLAIFINLLQNDTSEEVRAAVALGLRKFVVLAESKKLLTKDTERIRESLLNVVNSTTESLDVKRRAIEALSPFSDPFIKELIRWAYSHDNPKMRESAVYAMGYNADPEWIPLILKEITNKDPAMRYEAACASGKMGEEIVVPHLVTLLKDDDLQVSLSAITALGSIGGSIAKRVLVSCLQLEDELILETTQEALEELEGNEDPLDFDYKH